VSDELSATTKWVERAKAPARVFADVESASSIALLAAVIAALVWCAISPANYDTVWSTHLDLKLGRWQIDDSLRTWINSGLMSLFFFVVGLEARREFDLGDLRERRRFMLPGIAGLAGMIVPSLIFLLVLHGAAGSHAWGTVMSTDTALALGALGVVGRSGVGERQRVFMVSVFVVDDVLALIVMTVVYSEHVKWKPLIIVAVVLAVVVVVQRFDWRPPAFGPAAALVGWVALRASGIDPIILGLLVGLATSAYIPSRQDLEEASRAFVLFREQPTAAFARSAVTGLTQSVSANLRMQARLLPWAVFVVVPFFALANAGLDFRRTSLADAYSSPVTWAVIVAYALGKPVGVLAGSWLVSKISRGRLRPSVGWATVTASGTLAGIGFTVSFIIADRTLHGAQLVEVKLGVITAAVISVLATYLVYLGVARLPERRRTRALLGSAVSLVDLYTDIDPHCDHIRGPADALVTLVEYGDLECPYCGLAEPIVRELLAEQNLRYVWRHLPLNDVHPYAQLAAEATEAAADQGRFWEMHDELLAHQDRLTPADLAEHAARIGLDADRLQDDLARHKHAHRIAWDVETAELSSVSGTPTFFINGRRHYGAYDIETLKASIDLARAQALQPIGTR
jgi:Na+/H+ antiporter NhaA